MPPRHPILEPRWPQDPDFATKMAQSTSKTPQLGAKMPPKSPNFDPKCIPRPPNFEPKAPQTSTRSHHLQSPSSEGQLVKFQAPSSERSIGGPAAGGEALRIYISAPGPCARRVCL